MRAAPRAALFFEQQTPQLNLQQLAGPSRALPFQEHQMRATYEKRRNVILVELTDSEAQQYLQTEINTRDPNLRKVENHWELTIPCSERFYSMSQRQRGGIQPWSPDELRAGIRAGVANRLVPAPTAVDPESFRRYKQQWMAVARPLLRNVRLLFPSAKHPQQRLTYDESRFRKNWRAKYVK